MIYSLVRKALFGFLVRAGVRQVARKSVDGARNDLEQRLPPKVVKVAESLPGDLMAAGGAALVAADGAKSVAKASKVAASGLAAAGTGASKVAKRARMVPTQVASVRDQFVSDVDEVSKDRRRSMMSDFQRINRGEGAATDALLDHRIDPSEPLPELVDPVKAGRRRFVRPLPAAPVNRVQRSYRAAAKAWDRPRRSRLPSGDKRA